MAGRTHSVTRKSPASRRASQPAHSYRRRQRRPRRRLLACSILLAVILLSAFFSGLIFLQSTSQSLVVASVPYWNIDYGTTSVLSNRHTFSEMSPWMYGLNRSGQIVPQYGPAQAATVDAQLARLRAARIPLVPTLANVVQGKWVYRPVLTSLLHNARLRARHVAAIVTLVQRQHYAGIDIDYEDLRAGDRSAFTAFITQLADALHANGKILSVQPFREADQSWLRPAQHRARLSGYWPGGRPGAVDGL